MSDVVIEIMDMWFAGVEAEVIAGCVGFTVNDVLDCIEEYKADW